MNDGVPCGGSWGFLALVRGLQGPPIQPEALGRRVTSPRPTADTLQPPLCFSNDHNAHDPFGLPLNSSPIGTGPTLEIAPDPAGAFHGPKPYGRPLAANARPSPGLDRAWLRPWHVQSVQSCQTSGWCRFPPLTGRNVAGIAGAHARRCPLETVRCPLARSTAPSRHAVLAS